MTAKPVGDTKWAFLFPLLAGAVAAVAYPGLPAEIPMQWGTAGQVNWTAGKDAIFLFPLMMLGMILLFRLMPKIDPKKENYQSFGKYYDLILVVLCLLLLVIELYTIAWCHGVRWSPSGVVQMAVGCLFVVLGNAMPKFRANWFCGIRTPWTLANEEVWYRTHRMAGKCFVVSGLLMILSGFLPEGFGLIVLAIVLLCAIWPMVYSYFCFRNLKPKE